MDDHIARLKIRTDDLREILQAAANRPDLDWRLRSAFRSMFDGLVRLREEIDEFGQKINIVAEIQRKANALGGRGKQKGGKVDSGTQTALQ